MNPQWTEWTEFLVQQGARHEGESLNFGTPQAERNAAQEGSIMVPLADLALIRATGADATTFLHNLLTNDIEGLAPTATLRAGLCTPKGRLLANFLIWRDEADLLLALPADQQAAILKRLSMYLLRSKAKLCDASTELVLLGISGPRAEEALTALAPGALPAAPMHTSRCAHGQILRLAEQRYLLALQTTAAATVWQTLRPCLTPAGPEAWHWLDIMAGLPHICAATQEAFVPQMINYELIGGVSFKKGCYPGQEIVARTQYLGKVKRRMYRLHSETGQPTPGMPVFAPETADQPCGLVVSAATAPQGGHDLLAVLLAHCAEAGVLHLGTPQGPTLLLQPLPYAVT